MNIEDFWAIFESQSNILLDAGFQFKKKCWQLETENYILSYEAPTNKFGVGFQVRFLTLCLLHKDVWPDTDKIKITKDISKDSIFNISPRILSKYKKSLIKDRIWHFYPDMMDDNGLRYCYLPVYYGGEKKWIMKDDSFSELENQVALKNTMSRMFKLNYIEEAICKNVLYLAAQNICDYGKYWADKLTFKSAIYQLEKYGNDWWISNEWIKAYKNATQHTI